MSTFLDELYAEANTFLIELFESINKTKIDISGLEIDHICYRVACKNRYAEIKDIMTQHGLLLHESMVNDRPIAIFKLEQVIDFNDKKITLLELPAPKPNSKYKEGFEHIEFVIKERLSDFLLKYAAIEFDVKELSKKINPSVRLKLGPYSVKFHEQSLAEVIKL